MKLPYKLGILTIQFMRSLRVGYQALTQQEPIVSSPGAHAGATTCTS